MGNLRKPKDLWGVKGTRNFSYLIPAPLLRLPRVAISHQLSILLAFSLTVKA